MRGPSPDFTRETSTRASLVAGVDEVGRGPLAGPVFAAAVCLTPGRIPAGLADSKTLTPAHRASLAALIHDQSAVGIGFATVAEIDHFNILQASHLAMRRALAALPLQPDHALIDGPFVPHDLPCPATAIVRGDALSPSIAAASVVAKVARDTLMADLARGFPGYGWERNMGYPTPEHRAALIRLGVTPHHRRSFAPVHNILCQAIGSSP